MEWGVVLSDQRKNVGVMISAEQQTRVLVVDDEAELADNLSEILKARGYVVGTATNGAEAMALCRETSFDIAIVDIKLPDTDGLALVQRLADTSARTDCVLITGYASLETAVEAVRQKNVAGYEIKPLDTHRLLSLVTQIAQRKRAEDALRKANDELEARVAERTSELAGANRKLHAEIAERKELEDHLRRAQRMESIGTLASGVAHNFNNILGIILGNAELLKMALDQTHEAQEFVGKIVLATERAASLAQQMLAVARRGACDRSHISTASLIDGVTQTLGVMLDSNVQIHWRPDGVASHVFVNRPDVEQVLMNICLNARDAMPKGGSIEIETRTVELSPQFCDAHENMVPGTHVCISISDTGSGIDRETLGRIFDPFFTTKDQGKGTGLGLSTAYGTVASHGGCVDVESEPGKGSTFRVYLPAAPEGEPEETSRVAPVLDRGTDTILLVDDEEDIRVLGRQILERLGYTVLTAENGLEAIEVYRNHPERIDAVILDYMMPEVDGEDTFAEMKRIDPDVKVLVASGYQNEGRIEGILHAGALGFVHKPYHVSQLSQSLRQVLDTNKE